MTGTPDAIDEATGSAVAQGDLWGARARDWAELMESWNGWAIPLYRQVLERLERRMITTSGGVRIEDEYRYLIATA